MRKKDSEDEAIEMKRRMTLVLPDETFPSNDREELLPSGVEERVDTPNGIQIGN